MAPSNFFCYFEFFNRLHRVPGVEIRYLACLTLNLKIQKNLIFFWIFGFRLTIFSFLSYRAWRWLKKSFIDHISICNHNLGDFWLHRRGFLGGKLIPPSRMGRFRPPSQIGLRLSWIERMKITNDDQIFSSPRISTKLTLYQSTSCLIYWYMIS